MRAILYECFAIHFSLMEEQMEPFQSWKKFFSSHTNHEQKPLPSTTGHLGGTGDALAWEAKSEFLTVSQSKNCGVWLPSLFLSHIVIKPCCFLLRKYFNDLPSSVCLCHHLNLRLYCCTPSISTRLVTFVSWQLTWFPHPITLFLLISLTEMTYSSKKKILLSLLSCSANYCTKWKSFSPAFIIFHSLSNLIYCASCCLCSIQASKNAFVVWFQLFLLPEIQFQPSMSIPTTEIET